MSPVPDTPSEVTEVLERCGITRLRHFTTDRGALGMLSTGAILSRKNLSEDKYLERIYLPNCPTRRDGQWIGHVSLSVSEINASFFAICSGSPRWHAGMDGHWVIVELDASLLTHDDVWFVTTNNMYTGADRAVGAAGLEALFDDPIYPYRPRHTSPVVHRTEGMPGNVPTDAQAEALYPDRIPTTFIRRMLVREPAHTDDLRGQLHVFRALNPNILIEVEPEAFESMPPPVITSP